jgi:hypothetical protein
MRADFFLEVVFVEFGVPAPFQPGEDAHCFGPRCNSRRESTALDVDRLRLVPAVAREPSPASYGGQARQIRV